MLNHRNATADVLGQDRAILILSNQYIPDAVVATKATADSPDRHEEGARSLLDDIWIICTDDPAKKLNSSGAVSFDNVIDYGGVRLSDPEARHDGLTKKLVCIAALTIGVRRRKLSGSSTLLLMQGIDWFVRWRRGIGILRNAELCQDHFEDFVERVRGGDILDLVPVIARLDRMTEEIATGNYRLPLALDKAYPGGLRIDWFALAAKLGTSMQALGSSHDFKLELVDRLPLACPQYAAVLAAGIGGKEKSNKEQFSAARVEELLRPWSYLYDLGVQGILQHDSLIWDPFEMESRSKIASEKGREPARTRTLVPQDLLRILDTAAAWVIDYSDHILSAIDLLLTHLPVSLHDNRAEKRRRLSLRHDQTRPIGMPPLWLGWKPEKTEPDRISVRDALKLLMTACLILVSGLGARRVGEITSLRSGCLIDDRSGLVELAIYIEKTLRDVDRVPVPPLMRKVIHVLEAASASTRAETGEDWLFNVRMYTGLGHRGVLLRFDQLLPKFARINNLPLPDGWSEWTLKSHQLRRGFAICYYYGFQAASLDALSRFLRHFDPEVTRIYVNELVAGSMGRLREEIEARTKAARAAMSEADRQWMADAKRLLDDLADRGETFNAVRCEALVHRMLAMWDGSEAPIGQGAAKLYGDLNTMVTKASAEVRIAARSNDPSAIRQPLMALLQDYAKRNYLEPVPGHAAHCVCRPGDAADLAQAACLKAKSEHRTPWRPEQIGSADVRPDYAFSGAYVCLGCQHCAAFNENQQVIAGKLESLDDAITRAATPAAKESAADKYKRLKALVASATEATKAQG